MTPLLTYQYLCPAASYFNDDSYLIAQSVTTSTASTSRGSNDQPCSDLQQQDIFVPWRRGGFSSSNFYSDSISYESTTTDDNHVASGKRWRPIRAAKSLFAHKKTSNRKAWLRRERHYLHTELQEDPDVMSMQKSHTSGHSHQMIGSPQGCQLPSMFLGSFAAAIHKPCPPCLKVERGPISGLVLDQAERDADVVVQPTKTSGEVEGSTQLEGVHPKTRRGESAQASLTEVQPRILINDLNHLKADDSFPVYSRSDFDSSSSSGQSLSDKCPSDSSSDTERRLAVDCSFEAAISSFPIRKIQDEAHVPKEHETESDTRIHLIGLSYEETDASTCTLQEDGQMNVVSDESNECPSDEESVFKQQAIAISTEELIQVSKAISEINGDDIESISPCNSIPILNEGQGEI